MALQPVPLEGRKIVEGGSALIAAPRPMGLGGGGCRTLQKALVEERPAFPRTWPFLPCRLDLCFRGGRGCCFPAL